MRARLCMVTDLYSAQEWWFSWLWIFLGLFDVQGWTMRALLGARWRPVYTYIYHNLAKINFTYMQFWFWVCMVVLYLTRFHKSPNIALWFSRASHGSSVFLGFSLMLRAWPRNGNGNREQDSRYFWTPIDVIERTPKLVIYLVFYQITWWEWDNV